MAYLQAINGPDQGTSYPLSDGTVVMGRSPDCDLVIDVGAVSRRHAQVLGIGDAYFIEDLKSRNGTYVNNEMIKGRVQLQPGDEIKVCEVAFTFGIGSPGAGPPPAFPDSPATIDGSGYAPMLVDDDAALEKSNVMSRINVYSTGGSVRISSSPEAKLKALLSISKNLGKAIKLDEVLPLVLESLFQIFMQADRGFIVLEGDGGRLVPRWTKLRREGDEDNLRISRTVTRQVMDTQEAILSADAASDARFQMSQSIADFRIRSMMCAPLIDSEGKSFGVLQIDTLDQRHRFDEQDLELLASVATQAALAIDMAQLHEQALRQRELERDLELARQVQRSILPNRPPELAGFNFFNYYAPAAHVGGDYFDYVPLPDGRMAVLVADVVGHGIAAAMIMTKLSAEARFSLATHAEPAQAITHLNKTFSMGGVEDRFVTMIVAVLDPRSQELTIVNAGHMAPLVRYADDRLEEPGDDLAGLPLGVADDYEYEQCVVPLARGDLVTLYTDGLNEAMNPAGELYGMERLRSQVQPPSASPQALAERLLADVEKWSNHRPQNDDMCLVCFAREEDGNATDHQAPAIG